MATRIQVRRDTAANWAAAPTTVLASGEIGFESDTLQFKIGDGAAQWQNLEYAGGTTPIRQNASGTTITDLNAAALVNNGNAKYLILGADSVSNEPAGLTTATDGQLLVTVSKYDYLGTSAANERLLMTLTTLTTGKTYYRTYNGSWSSWYLVITGDASGNATVPGDLAVNGGDITTTSNGTATVFNTNATTLNVGQAATTVSIGATTGTATIRNATTAISGAATVGSTLAVTGNTTLTGDLAVNGADITTTSNGTATVFNTNAAALCLGEAAPTVSIGASTGTTTINNDLAVNGGDITTNQSTAAVFNTTATTLNVGGAATTVAIGAATGTTTVNNDLAVNGGDITTNQTAATVFKTTATTLDVGWAATALQIGATTGTTTIRNATTAINGAATVGSTLTVAGTTTLANATLSGDLAVNGGDITTSAATATVFDSNATSVDIAGAATTLNIADAATTAQTINIGTGATASGATKTINIGTGGDAGSTTNINLGDADGGLTAINKNATIAGTLGVTGVTTLTGGLATQLAASNMSSGCIVQILFGTVSRVAQTGIVASGTRTLATASITPKKTGSTIYVFPIASEITDEIGTFTTDAMSGTVAQGRYHVFNSPCWFSAGIVSAIQVTVTTTVSRSGGNGTLSISNRNHVFAANNASSKYLFPWSLVTDSSVDTTARSYTLTLTNNTSNVLQMGVAATTYVMIEVAS